MEIKNIALVLFSSSLSSDVYSVNIGDLEMKNSS